MFVTTYTNTIATMQVYDATIEAIKAGRQFDFVRF